ncbi:MAG: 1-deoxy-D-xylulose-5-phosphate reductoisomerase [Bacteroidia bacterium]|jgi:1-deoxy-D-xylulose-5-phosphate reductoisomerase|nr:1-deoxy-D-xylulose-5-phosphate reductoisomerase [Bacteroidia bacterium]
MEKVKKKIAILGSTGSIGTQALEVVSEQNEYLEVEVLTGNSNADLLISQAIKYKPNHVVIADESKYLFVKDALDKHDIKVFAGNKAIEELMGITEADIVLTAMVGYSGLKPTIKAIENKKRIALANKETLVVAGEIITKLCGENHVDIIPVDSEHSAIFQCLVGESLDKIDKVILTASGGPFRGKKREDLVGVTKAQALKHPNWSMGAKITIDSATMMNKGLEVIEAKWLFGVGKEKIDVVVHPQSIIHSMVEFNDGSIKAQMGLPDMKLPIHYSFFFPSRQLSTFKRMSFKEITQLSFEEPDPITFRNLGLAYEAMEKGGNMACILNAANEIAVQAFLEDKIKFLEIAELNERCMNAVSFIRKPSIEDYVETDAETRRMAHSFLS